MRQLASVLLLVVATVPVGAKWKTKEKTFEPVAITDVRKAAGRYVGIDPDYVVDLKLDDEARLSGKIIQFGVASPLRDLRIEGSELYATVGGLPLHGTFVNRSRDGNIAFGLLVHDADIKTDEVTLSEIFCRVKKAA
jgi:hypothetical protein